MFLTQLLYKTRKYTTATDRALSSPGSPEKTTEFNNNEYTQLNDDKSDSKSKIENTIISELSGRILLNSIQLCENSDIVSEIKGNSIKYYDLELIPIVKAIRANYRSNLIIQLTSQEVAEICRNLEINSLKSYIETIFPVLPNYTQYELVSNCDFYNDTRKRGNNLNVFFFMGTLHRSELREFFCKIQCPLLLLTFTKFRLENEIRNNKIEPELSQIMELLYLFNDFMDQDYLCVQNMKNVKHMCNQDYLEHSNQSQFNKDENFGTFTLCNMNLDSKNICCQKCFGKENWRRLSFDILRMFITKFDDFKYYYNIDYKTLGPCLEAKGVENQTGQHDYEEKFKTFASNPIRNGGIIRIIYDCIFILLRDSMRVKFNSNQSQNVSTPVSSSYQNKATNENIKVSSVDILENDRSILVLIQLINQICFVYPLRSEESKDSNPKQSNSPDFYLSYVNSQDIKDIKIYSSFFDKSTVLLNQTDNKCSK